MNAEKINIIEKNKEEENEKKESEKNEKIKLNKELIERSEKIYSNYVEIDNNSKPKYRFNFSKIIMTARDLSDKDYNYNKIEFDCNMCINFSQIDKSHKIDAFSLISFIHFNKGDYNHVFYLNNRILKYIKKYIGVESFIYIRTLYRASKLLLNINNIYYSYHYNNLANEISENSKISKDASDTLSELTNEIKEKMTNYISNKTELLLKYNESSTLELITNISKIINNIENQKINDDNNYYIINKIWLEKAKKFIIEYERLCKLNNEKDLKFFLNKTFNSDYIYCKYLGEESSKITIKEKDKNLPIFPGPIDNYSITLYKDFWKDPLNIQDNFFIKDNLEINKDYYLINKENWDFLDKFFYSTNELIRKGNNNDLISLKCLIFHEKLINKNYQHYLRRRYIQISKNETVSDLKNKIIRCINEIDKHEREKIEKLMKTENDPFKRKRNLEARGLIYEDEEENIIKENKKISKELNNNNNEELIFDFFELPYIKKDILSEITISYVNKISYIKYDIKKIEVDDNLTMDKFPCNGLRKNGNILLIEIHKKNKINFLQENNNKCIVCQKEIIKEIKCEKCHLNKYCSSKCLKSSEMNIKIDKCLNNYLIEEFSLKKLFQNQISEIISKDSTHGLIGLKNLGNTCYMNSALQCLSNTEDLTKYILLNYYDRDKNYVNKLGYNGQLIEIYSNLIKNLWNEKIILSEEETGDKVMNILKYVKPYSPKKFREYIGEILPQFKSSKQQDSHEFISLLLDNLHEDINRITNKPYLELEERKEGESDKEASERWWKIHRLRENSIISDLFHGQLKSTISCNICKNTSITYNPFMFLSLSLPVSPLLIKLKIFYKNQSFLIHIPIWDKCKVFHLKNKCFEFFSQNNNLDDDKKINLFEAVVLDKDKIIEKIIKNDDEFILPYYEKQKEICIYKKESLDHFNIYLYPVKITTEKIFFISSEKLNFLSYPIGISITYETNIEQLNQILINQLKHMFEENIKENKLFNLLIYHNYKEIGLSWFSSKKSCEFCNQPFNMLYCNLLSSCNKHQSISNIMNKLKDGRPFIILIHSEHFINNSAYKNEDLSIEKHISEVILEKKEKPNLYGCLDMFEREEKLKEDTWYCNKCKSLKSANKQVSIYRLPNYLIIHFKRFNVKNSVLTGKLLSEKNNTFIDYPIKELDLSNNVIGNKDNCIYNLYGVIEHFGGLSYGHYIAKCKNLGKLFEFNDDKVKEINSDKIVTQNAYVLFYKRKDLENEF